MFEPRELSDLEVERLVAQLWNSPLNESTTTSGAELFVVAFDTCSMYKVEL